MRLLQALSILSILSTVYSLQLSGPESFLLKSRLESIKESILSSVVELLPPSNTTNDIAFIFPGAGGVDELTKELTFNLNNKHVWTRTMDWKEYRGGIATAAFDAEAVGEAVATLLLQQQAYKSVHVIGISVGGFAANSMAKCLFESTNKPDYVRLTLLDPFCSRGLFGIGYGAKNFGGSADYAEHYLNTDDPVPTTNDPLPNCYCIDVTSASERDLFVLPEGESMHCWPVAYFARHAIARNEDGSIHYPKHDKDHPRGMVYKLQ